MSITLDIPNRPFATENLSGLMLPDGIFVTTLGRQGINASLRNPVGEHRPAPRGEYLPGKHR